MNRITQAGIPLAYGTAGGLLLLTAILTDSAISLSAVVLLTALLLAAVADPPTAGADPRRRAAGRLLAAIATLGLATISVLNSLFAGFGSNPQWRLVATTGVVAAVLLVAPLLALQRTTLELPIRRSERASYLRGGAVAICLVIAVVASAYVLPAIETTVAIVFGVLATLEGVALARPGGAGLRRSPTADETRVVESAIAIGPAGVRGYRRLIVRSTGGADYLSVDLLVDPDISPARRQAIRYYLEQSIHAGLPDLVVTVKIARDQRADDYGQTSSGVLPSAPWQTP